jgi:hypothetical protein
MRLPRRPGRRLAMTDKMIDSASRLSLFLRNSLFLVLLLCGSLAAFLSVPPCHSGSLLRLPTIDYGLPTRSLFLVLLFCGSLAPFLSVPPCHRGSLSLTTDYRLPTPDSRLRSLYLSFQVVSRLITAINYNSFVPGFFIGYWTLNNFGAEFLFWPLFLT